MSLGDLTEEDVEGIRTGGIADPSVGKTIALARAFGVSPSYLLRGDEDALFLDEHLIEALRDETVRTITRESAVLPDRERRLVLGIVRQLG